MFSVATYSFRETGFCNFRNSCFDQIIFVWIIWFAFKADTASPKCFTYSLLSNSIANKVYSRISNINNRFWFNAHNEKLIYCLHLHSKRILVFTLIFWDFRILPKTFSQIFDIGNISEWWFWPHGLTTALKIVFVDTGSHILKPVD